MGGVKDRGGGCQISDDREGCSRGCQAALCGERLSGAMACGRDGGRNGGRIPVAMSPTGAMVCPTPNGVNTILCPREREHRKSNRDVEANHSAMVSNKMSLTLK